MEGYSVQIKTTSMELSAKERVRIKDTSNAVKLDELAAENKVITPVAYAVLGIHNEKSENKDYEVYVIIDNNGTKYVTGSPSFFTAFKDIWDELADDGEEFSIEVYRLESKNYKGKYFLTCSLV